ncbi:glycosyltransferase family 2 protein [Planctomyces sp. SH-PL14]|uniref:glycosyltransferase family 2 protein n=1 Tax=Planctomyces sp. SH-PL14 TaxID=1632864 RepID=UPI00078BDB2A|nr:glycosyltransferase family 2 protein [Planctomyces sp. SH-PL14]AMV22650.1 4,4'-diaponeurosporenoate glycosyltransferase [Planctomyces sp. SH-PL14]
MMTVAASALVWATFGASAFVAGMFLVNLLFFRRAPRRRTPDALRSGASGLTGANAPRLQISVLIPARNEALRIGPLLDSILRNEGVDFEICVLDDESTDGTGDIVRGYAERDARVRLVRGTPMPGGWSGKQYACWQLARQARFSELVFLDADVALSRDALRRAVSLRVASGVDLLSGFPRQRVETIGEQLLIPLIHQILLCFLPFPLMRWTRMTGAAAGCGQFFVTTRAAYEATGGHGAIRQSLHDGIMLPRAYRSQGLRTDLFDASDVAECRMYTSFSETWLGLLKNATEGFAKMPLLLVMTVLLSLAFLSPVVELAMLSLGLLPRSLAVPVLASGFFALLPRLWCCLRYDRAWRGCILHPLSVVIFLVIQWTAWSRKRFGRGERGRGVQWRQRSYEIAAS